MYMCICIYMYACIVIRFANDDSTEIERDNRELESCTYPFVVIQSP